jgi:putative PIN family toxin of toxin-antitoxin system
VRILLDSNVWLAILTTDGFCRQMWRQSRGVSKFCASPEILDEIEEKLRLKFGFHARHAHLLTLFVRRQTIPVTVTDPPPKVCRDPDDDPILAAAVHSGCAYLVTGDHDLLALNKFEGVGMVTPRKFAELIAST